MTIESTVVDLLKESQNLQEAIAADPANARNNVQTQMEGEGGTSKKANRVTQGALPAETMRKLQAEAYDELDEGEVEMLESIDEETFDQLDEISGGLVGRYIQKARADADARVTHGKNLNDHPKVAALTAKRSELINRREYTKTGDSKHRKQIDKLTTDIDAAKKKLDPDYERTTSPRKRLAGIDRAIEKLRYGKLTNEALHEDEDFEQLDELSKSTLGSYIKKASHDVATLGAVTRQAAVDSREAREKNDYKTAREKEALSNKVFDKSWKRRGDMAKAVDRLTKEDVDLSEDVAALFNGEEGLTEEFRQKAETIFEAVVINRIQEEVARIEEAYESALEEAIQEEVEGLVEHIDGYLNLAVEQWMVENEVALESGMKSDILESFVGGMKQLFKEHYVEVPEEKLDLVSEMEQQIDELNAKLNESVALNVQMHKALNEGAKSEIIAEAVQGLTDVQAEKLQMIAEELVFEDVDSFAQKVQVIRENYFAKKPARAAVASPAFLSEETIQEEKEVPHAMRAYVETISTLNR